MLDKPTKIKLVQDWIAALRSGEYKKGEGALKTQVDDRKPEFCCLGVLCEVALKAGIQITVEDGSNGRTMYSQSTSSLGNDDLRSLVEEGYVGNGITHGSGFEDALISMNDGKFETDPETGKEDSVVYSFDQIADHIQEYLLKVIEVVD